jgi:hypothetical protein
MVWIIAQLGIIFLVAGWDFVTGLTGGSFTGAALGREGFSSYESSVFKFLNGW